ncbi:MAG: YgfZ/GcvT domain-containing protein [Geminicoccaceae bacterium]
MASPRCTLLPQRGLARLGGPEARSFLQGLVSNDIDLLDEGHPLYAALLTAQGRYLFDFILYGQGDAILLEGERDRLPALIQRLTMYRLRAQVTIENLGQELAVLAVFGPGSDELEASAGAMVAADPRLSELGTRVVLPSSAVDGFIAANSLTTAPIQDYERLRLTLGVPDGSRDLVPEKALLLESGFEELHGVSFTKGCFVGQELTARTKHRALVKRRLLPVRVDGPLPAPGTPVTRGGRDAGEVRSGMDGLALALLRLDQLAASEEPLRAGEAVLTPSPSGWLPLSILP